MRVELEAWRIAGRCSDIAAVIEELEPLLCEALGAKSVHVFRLDPERLRVERILGTTEELPPDAFSKIATWCHEGRVLHAETRTAGSVVAHLVPKSLKGPYLLGPLTRGGEPLGAVLACAKKDF